MRRAAVLLTVVAAVLAVGFVVTRGSASTHASRVELAAARTPFSPLEPRLAAAVRRFERAPSPLSNLAVPNARIAVRPGLLTRPASPLFRNAINGYTCPVAAVTGSPCGAKPCREYVQSTASAVYPVTVAPVLPAHESTCATPPIARTEAIGNRPPGLTLRQELSDGLRHRLGRPLLK